MQDRDDLPDDVPIADAVEQNQDAAPEPATFDAVDEVEVPIDANPSDWQEQLQEVDVDDDLDDYR